jgi:hypothetical protein
MTQPNRASSLATAIDRVEERMALTELNQETPEDRAVKPTEAALEVTVSAESSVSPEQVLAAARDFSAHRAQIWRNVEAKRLEVHECGDSWADVTEGTMVLSVFWERCRYDWSAPTQITATVIESNVFKRGSSWQLQAAPRSGGGSVVKTTVIRDYRHGFKGTFARAVNHLGGRRLFGWFLRSTLAAIEKTPKADSAINPHTATP